jgi:hypothetical protein
MIPAAVLVAEASEVVVGEVGAVVVGAHSLGGFGSRSASKCECAAGSVPSLRCRSWQLSFFSRLRNFSRSLASTSAMWVAASWRSASSVCSTFLTRPRQNRGIAVKLDSWSPCAVVVPATRHLHST